jgi:hypothetical protein
MSEPLFCYCLTVQDREFLIEVAHDGTIYWDDYQMRRRVRAPDDRCLEIKTLLGDTRARKRLNAEIDEFMVSFRLNPELFARFTEAASLFDAGQWTVAHEEELDQCLVPLFWSDVNPHINDPMERPPGGSAA